jgi:hypothetical protein
MIKPELLWVPQKRDCAVISPLVWYSSPIGGAAQHDSGINGTSGHANSSIGAYGGLVEREFGIGKTYMTGNVLPRKSLSVERPI